MYETIEAFEASETTQMAAIAAFAAAVLCMLVCHLLPTTAHGYVHPMNEADPETVGRLRGRVRFYGLFIAVTCVHYVAGRMISERLDDSTNMVLLVACVVAAIISAVLVIVWIFRHLPVWLVVLLFVLLPCVYCMIAVGAFLVFVGQAFLCVLSVIMLVYSMCRLFMLKWPAPEPHPGPPVRDEPPQPPPSPPSRERKVFTTVLKLLGPSGRELVIEAGSAYPVPYTVGRAAYLYAGDASDLVEDAQFYVKASSLGGNGPWYLTPLPNARNKVFYDGALVSADVILENDKTITLASPDGEGVSIPLRVRFRPVPHWVQEAPVRERKIPVSSRL